MCCSIDLVKNLFIIHFCALSCYYLRYLPSTTLSSNSFLFFVGERLNVETWMTGVVHCVSVHKYVYDVMIA